MVHQTAEHAVKLSAKEHGRPNRRSGYWITDSWRLVLIDPFDLSVPLRRPRCNGVKMHFFSVARCQLSVQGLRKCDAAGAWFAKEYFYFVDSRLA